MEKEPCHKYLSGFMIVSLVQRNVMNNYDVGFTNSSFDMTLTNQSKLTYEQRHSKTSECVCELKMSMLKCVHVQYSIDMRSLFNNNSICRFLSEQINVQVPTDCKWSVHDRLIYTGFRGMRVKNYKTFKVICLLLNRGYLTFSV